MAGDIVLQLRDTRYPGQMEMRFQAADEIDRLQKAKRRALMIADERSKENVALRKALEQIRDDMLCDPKDVAENALNAVVGSMSKP